MINWVHPQSGEVVYCDPAKVAANWRHDPKFLPAGGGHMGKIDYFTKHFAAGKECDVPEGGFAARNTLKLAPHNKIADDAPASVLIFDEGRNRTRWCLDNGEQAVPIRFLGSDIEMAKALLV